MAAPEHCSLLVRWMTCRSREGLRWRIRAFLLPPRVDHVGVAAAAELYEIVSMGML